MLNRIVRISSRIVGVLLAAGMLTLFLPRIITAIYASTRLYSVEAVPAKKVAIVFGAGLNWDGSPTPILRDRVTTASLLYFNGKADKLLFSGDNRFVNYNEPGAMHRYALSLGVPENAIVLDFAGRSTYDTCYRAQKIFGVKEAILVTQDFHLPRALFTCQALGLKVIGVSADQRSYSTRSWLYWNIRELPATLNAFWQTYVTRPLPVLGEPELIFPPAEIQ